LPKKDSGHKEGLLRVKPTWDRWVTHKTLALHAFSESRRSVTALQEKGVMRESLFKSIENVRAGEALTTT